MTKEKKEMANRLLSRLLTRLKLSRRDLMILLYKKKVAPWMTQ